METSELKSAHILDYLQSNGHTPVKIKYGSAWFKSPTRSETNPSFKVDLNKNLWYDFGTGEGGNIIDLIVKLTNSSVSDAFTHLGSNAYPSWDNRYATPDDSGKIRIDKIQTLQNPSLVSYVRARRIHIACARRFCSEAFYSVHRKQYYALAFANDKGGYELRNPYFKTGSSPKYYTTIQGEDDSKLNVFEGFMDFLSCCTYYWKVPKHRTIILNSLSFLPRIEPMIVDAEKIYLYLDNDEAGRKATNDLMASFDHVTDMAPVVYPHHKDFNEFLMR